MKETTIGIIIKDEKILLGMKKRGFGKGFFNSPGGKLELGENIFQTMIRELSEESGLISEEKDLKYVGYINFYFENKSEWDNICHIFLIKNFSGELIESDEMLFDWYNLEDIPYEKMWDSDKIWLKKVIKGEEINYNFFLDKDGNVIKYNKY